MTRRTRLLATLGALATLSACADRSPTALGYGLRVYSGVGVSDTVEARLPNPLVVELRDAGAQPVAGRPIEFTTVNRARATTFPDQWAYVAPVGTSRFGTRVIDTTDADGRARVDVALGVEAGTALIVVRNPADGQTDTAAFTVRAGHLAGVRAIPRDTAVYVGHTVTLRSSAVDRWGNPRPEPVALSLVSGPVTLSGTTVTGTSLGTARIAVRLGEYADTGTVAVPPPGVLALFTAAGVATMRTDGSDLRILVPGQQFGRMTSWSPSGTEIVFDRGYGAALQVVTVATGAVRTITANSPDAAYPKFSRDGAWVYYGLADAGIHRVHPDGTGDEQVVAPSASTLVVSPAPSPDGRQLAFVRGWGAYRDTLTVLDLQTGVETSLHVPGNAPAWSPTAPLILYNADQDDNGIRVVPPAAGSPSRLGVPGASYGWAHEWSPDGRWVVAYNGWNDRLEIIEPSTNLVIPLGFSRNFAAPSWMP